MDQGSFIPLVCSTFVLCGPEASLFLKALVSGIYQKASRFDLVCSHAPNTLLTVFCAEQSPVFVAAGIRTCDKRLVGFAIDSAIDTSKNYIL